MNNLGIFLIGLVVTAMVGGALWLLIYGAWLDGRTDESDVTDSEAELIAQADANLARAATPTHVR